MKQLSNDYSRCNPTMHCPKKEDCARFTSTPTGISPYFDPSIGIKYGNNCTFFISNKVKS